MMGGGMSVETETEQDLARGAGSPIRGRRLRQAPAMAALESPSFRRFFGPQALSMAGRFVQTAVIGYLVYDVTGSNFLLGLLSFMQMVPQLLLAPFVGVAVDRFDRRRILAAQLSVQALGLFALAGLASLDVLAVPMIAVIVVIMGIANAFAYPASSSLLPSLVPMSALQSANAINSMMGNLTRIIAPWIAGRLIDISGITAALLFGAGMYVPAAGMMLLVPLIAAAMPVTAAGGPLQPAAAPSVRRDIGEAIAYIRTNRLSRSALANDIAPYLFGLSHIALLPAVAKDTLGGDASTLGLLYSVAGAGAMLGTLGAGLLTGRGLRGPTIWTSLIGFGVGLLIVAMGSGQSLVLTGLFIAGAFQMLYIIQNDTLVQTFAEDRYRGRAVAAQSMVNGLMPIGFLILGLIAELGGLRVAFATS